MKSKERNIVLALSFIVIVIVAILFYDITTKPQREQEIERQEMERKIGFLKAQDYLVVHSKESEYSIKRFNCSQWRGGGWNRWLSQLRIENYIALKYFNQPLIVYANVEVRLLWFISLADRTCYFYNATQTR